MTDDLPDAALARRDQQRAGPRPGLVERHRPALGVTLRLPVTMSVAMAVAAVLTLQLGAQFLALLVGHHRELEVDAR